MITLAIVVAGCADGDGDGDQGAAGGRESFKIGVILPLEGPAAAVGRDFETGLNVFREIAPEAEGLELEYTVCDDGTTPEGAAACARRLATSDDVDMIYGPIIAGPHSGAAPVLAQGPPSITASPYVEPDPDTPIFSAAGSNEDLDRTTLQFAADRGFTNVGVLATTDVSGETAVENVGEFAEDLDLEVAIERMGPADVDATAQLNSLIDEDPDMLYLAAPGAATAVALRGLQQLGVDLPTALNWSNTTTEFLTAAKPAFPSEAYYAVSPAWLPDALDDPDRAEQVRRFQETFEQQAGKPVSFVVQGTYDAFQIIASTFAEVGAGSEAIVEHLESLEDFQGLNWRVTYSESDHSGSEEGNYVMLRYDAATDTWSLPEE